MWEKQQQSSENSSQPPSKDNPYGLLSTTEESSPSSESESATATTEQEQIEESVVKEKKKKSPRKPGKQTGAKGFGRKQPLKAETLKFLQQLEVGYGDYTKERHQWLDKLTIDDFHNYVKQRKVE